MKTCLAWVTSFNRPFMLKELLIDIEREAAIASDAGIAVNVCIYDDASTHDMAEPETFARERGWSWIRSSRTHGRTAFAEFTGSIHADLRLKSADYYYALQDDIRLCRRFFQRSIGVWSEIHDEKKVSLQLYVDGLRETHASWTDVRPIRMGPVDRTQWVDCVFMSERRYYEALNFSLPVVPNDWLVSPIRGSGVGMVASRTLHKAGYHLYRTHESLVVHRVLAESALNHQVREYRDLAAIRFVDGPDETRRLLHEEPIVASLASIPGRVDLLKVTVESLLPQVDRINVMLNGYADVPSWLEHPRIVVGRSQDVGDRGDAGKFYWHDHVESYHLMCDDDIVYPKDYSRRMVWSINAWGRKAVVGVHGSWLPERCHDYYRERVVVAMSRHVRQFVPVHVLGTGTIGYHSSTLSLRRADFPSPNMADIWFSLALQRQGVPLAVLPHPPGWLRNLGEGLSQSIYRSSVRRARGPMDTAELQNHVVRTNADVWRLRWVGSDGSVRELPVGSGRPAVAEKPLRRSFLSRLRFG